MNNRQAIRIAIESMKQHRKSYMFDANLYRRGIAKGSVFENADEKVSKIDGAIEVLQQLEADLKTLQGAAAYLKSKDK